MMAEVHTEVVVRYYASCLDAKCSVHEYTGCKIFFIRFKSYSIVLVISIEVW